MPNILQSHNFFGELEEKKQESVLYTQKEKKLDILLNFFQTVKFGKIANRMHKQETPSWAIPKAQEEEHNYSQPTQ